MSSVLVTGGAGYIGSHACKAVASAGYQPVVYDNLACGHRWAVQWGPLEEGDIADRPRLDAVLQRYQPVAVMHFAAHAYVGESVADPAKYYRNNLAGTLTLLESMREHRVGNLVFSSTCATYGVPEQVPIREDHPQRPISPYGQSKRMIEQILRDFDSAYGLRSMALRYFNAAGADEQGRTGEDHDPETHLIPLVLDVALGRCPQVTLFGEDYDTPDGTCIRDYVHVDDLADAHLLALHALRDGAESNAYNLGYGQGFSVREVIDRARSVTGRAIEARVGPRRPGDPARLIADASKIKRELGWRPARADLTRILASAWRWHSSHFAPSPESNYSEPGRSPSAPLEKS